MQEGGEQINLKVVTQGGDETYFRCKVTTPLKRLMDAFCNRQSVSRNSVRFWFDGNTINETLTPEQLLMEVHGVSAITAGVRYNLIATFGDPKVAGAA